MYTVHVLPINDIMEHDERSDYCICGPKVELIDGGMLVTHHSLDGREQHESEPGGPSWTEVTV